MHTQKLPLQTPVFVEAPGLCITGLAAQASYARYSKVTDVVKPDTVNKIKMHQIKNNYEVNGYATVIVSESCDYSDIIEFLKDVDTDVKVIAPGFSIRDVEPCTYDAILSHQMAVDAFEYGLEHRNFIKGASNIVGFDEFLNIE